MLANCATREPLVRWSLGSKNERKAVVFAIAARNGSTKRRRVRNEERTRFRASRSMSRSSMARFARRVAHPEHSTEGRNSPQIARREPARFCDRRVVSHTNALIGPARDCQFMLRVLAFSDKAVTRSVIASRAERYASLFKRRQDRATRSAVL